MFHEKNSPISQKGFSFIELLLVVAIISIIAAASAPFLSRFLAVNDLEVSTDKVVSTIRKAQSYAMSGKDGAVWGFCKSGNSIRLYKTSCASPDYSEDFDISRVNINEFSDTSFSGVSGLRGEPSGSVLITISNSTGTNTVSINYAGGVSFND